MNQVARFLNILKADYDRDSLAARLQAFFWAAVLVATIAMLTGCVAQRTRLVDDRGRAFECRSTGAGVFSAVAAAHHHEECVKRAKERGFTTVVEPPRP